MVLFTVLQFEKLVERYVVNLCYLASSKNLLER